MWSQPNNFFCYFFLMFCWSFYCVCLHVVFITFQSDTSDVCMVDGCERLFLGQTQIQLRFRLGCGWVDVYIIKQNSKDDIIEMDNLGRKCVIDEITRSTATITENIKDELGIYVIWVVFDGLIQLMIALRSKPIDLFAVSKMSF